MTLPADTCATIPLPWLSALIFRGRDAESFLQGQLSNDLRALDADYGLLAGLHSAPGRVLALLRLARAADGAIVALLPADLATGIAAHLQRFVLRAQLRIEQLAVDKRVAGRTLADGQRHYLLADAVATPDDAAARAWHLADLRAGLPQIYAATSGQFTAQQLNLDTLGAISFAKGCYTGQEIIARTHYRGQVRRRAQPLAMQIAPPAPGSELALPGGGTARVIDSERAAAGWSELLVLPMQSMDATGAPAPPG